MNRRAGIVVVVLGSLVLLGLLLRVGVTAGGFELPPTPEIRSIRMQQAAAALIIGAALAVAGALLQTLLRNPLGEPWMLGLTAGAGLAVAVWAYVGYIATGQIVRYAPPLLPALVGALGALGLVYLLSQRRGFVDPGSLILIGVIVGIICGGLTTLVYWLLPGAGLDMAVRWMMGSISQEVTWGRLAMIGSLTVVGVGLATWLGPALDAASLSDDEAASVGVRVGLVRVILFLTAGMLTAGTIVLAGPIGLVGLICPHLVRLLAGPGHRTLIVGSALAGSALLLGADTAVSAIRAPSGRVPIGVVTALVGGPMFIVLLRRRAG